MINNAPTVIDLTKYPSNVSESRMLVIMVKRYQDTRANFSAHIPTALREYADAVEKGEKGKNDHEEFKASNGCRVLVIAGKESVSQ